MDARAAELLKIGVYAPIGLAALCTEKVLPVLRDEAMNIRQQVPAARFIGKMASDQVSAQLRTRCAASEEQLQNLAALAVSALTKLAGERPSPHKGGAAAAPNCDTGTKPAPSTVAGPDLDLAAIEGYNNLSSPQVIALLDGLTESELDEVAAFESSHRRRRTILNRIAQLRNP